MLQVRPAVRCCGGGETELAEDVKAEVAAGSGSLVVVFGQDGADKADPSIALGEDADDIGASADSFTKPLSGFLDLSGARSARETR